MHVISPLARGATQIAGRTVRGVGLLGLSLGERVASTAVHHVAGLTGHEVRRSDPDQEPPGTVTDTPSPTESDVPAPPPGPVGTPSAAEWREATDSPAPEADSTEDTKVWTTESDPAEPSDRADEEELRSPSGIPAAAPGYNPDTAETDLHQPDTEPLVDPGTAKAMRSEAQTLSDAADPDKG